MCNCINEIQQKIVENKPEHNKKKVLKATANAMFPISEGQMLEKRTYTDFDLTLEGQIKEVPLLVNHTYCPWCGVKYN